MSGTGFISAICMSLLGIDFTHKNSYFQKTAFTAQKTPERLRSLLLQGTQLLPSACPPPGRQQPTSGALTLRDSVHPWLQPSQAIRSILSESALAAQNESVTGPRSRWWPHHTCTGWVSIQVGKLELLAWALRLLPSSQEAVCGSQSVLG